MSGIVPTCAAIETQVRFQIGPQINLIQTYLAYVLIAFLYILGLYIRKWLRIRQQIRQL